MQGKRRQEKIDTAAAAAETLAMARIDSAFNDMNGDGRTGGMSMGVGTGMGTSMGVGDDERKETTTGTNTATGTSAGMVEEEEDEDAKADRLMSYRLSLRLRMKYAAAKAFDVDERDPDFGRTALHYACRRGKHDVVSQL